MSRSYQADERVFQKLRAAGKTSWDEQADPEANFDRFVMRPFLEESLAGMPQTLQGLSALEVGCGSGPICCFLAARGWAVRGIDVSQTALEMAQQNAAQRGLNVQFDAADICSMPEQPDRYDLIIDGHCLHCLVRDEHRREALTAIGRLLKPDGLFLIETMISHPALIVQGNYRIDPQGVLSIKVDSPAGHDDAFKNLSQKITGPRWAGNGSDARQSDEAIQRKESLRSDNEADGPFPAQPEGTPGISASYFVAPPQRFEQIESLRRRASSEAEIPCVAAPLSFEIDSKSDSEWFAPYRRLLTADQVATELRNTGFVIHSQRTMEQKDPRKPMLMQIRAGQRRAVEGYEKVHNTLKHPLR